MSAGLLGTPSVDINQWYQSALGRKADDSGLKYWQNRVASGENVGNVYNSFVDAATKNGEKVGYSATAVSPTPTSAQTVPQVGGGGSNPSAPNYPSAPTVTPTQWAVDKDQTVGGQIGKYLDANNPLQVQAKTFADQQSNAKGLLNSSLAVSAAQDAMYKNALPMAQQDASTYASSGQFNANAANAAAMANANNQVSTQNARLSSETQTALANLDAQTKNNLAQLDAQNKQILQTNSSAASLYNNTMNTIANISASQSMDAGAKQAATDNQLKLLKESLSAMSETAKTTPAEIASLDLGKYFTQALAPVAPVQAQPAATNIGSNYVQRNGTNAGRDR